jgi:serine/threonine-protein kinase RsbW
MSRGLTVLPGDPPDLHAVLFDRSFPSELSRKEALSEQLSDLMRSRGLVVEDDLHWLALCLDEALTNAILHGNEADDTVPIRIRLGCTPEAWTIQIDDQGDGFDPDDVPDQDESSALLLEHGRGIHLMREWLDLLTYYRHGATIVMTRKLAHAQ